jgi:hypothetical protein
MKQLFFCKKFILLGSIIKIKAPLNYSVSSPSVFFVNKNKEEFFWLRAIEIFR